MQFNTTRHKSQIPLIALLMLAALPAAGAARTPSAPTSAAGMTTNEPAGRPANELVGALPDISQEVNEPLRLYLQAHESMTMAEWLQEQDMREEAVDIFQESLALYKNIARGHPDWKTELVKFRINHCEVRLGELANTMSAIPPPVQRIVPVQVRRQEATLNAARTTARLRQAVQLEKVRDLPAAMVLYQEILEETPAYQPALQGAARISLQMSRLRQAREMLGQAAQLPDNDESTLLLRALLLCADGDFPAAGQLLEVVLKRNPWNPYAHLMLGAVQADAEHNEEALVSTKRAISLNPKLGDAYYNLAQLSLRSKPVNLDEVRAQYRKALKYRALPDLELEVLLE